MNCALLCKRQRRQTILPHLSSQFYLSFRDPVTQNKRMEENMVQQHFFVKLFARQNPQRKFHDVYKV